MTQFDLSEKIRNGIFSEPRLEHYVEAAGTRQMAQYLEKKRLGKGFAVLSDYALYIKGKCYFCRHGERPKKRRVDYRLDLPVVEHIRLAAKKPFWCVGLFFFFLILAPLLLVLDRLTGYGSSTPLTPWLDAVICLVLALIFLLLHYLARREFMQVKFRGGELSIDTRVLPEQETRRLIRMLRAMLEQQRPQSRTAPQPSHHNSRE